MAEIQGRPKPGQQPQQEPEKEPEKSPGKQPEQESGAVMRTLKGIWDFFGTLIRDLFTSVRAMLLLIVKTPYYLLPSATHATIADEQYNDRMKHDLADVVNGLDLDQCHFDVIENNWLDQLNWTSGRALRERNANELMRWWQIVLGVAIPVISGFTGESVLGFDKDHVITVIGIFLAVVTGVYQFRRPEERWRHYRIVHEKYLNELWEYVAMTGAYKPDEDKKTHRDMFPVFNERMTKIRRDDLSEFFGNVFPPSEKQQLDPVVADLLGRSQKPPVEDEE